MYGRGAFDASAAQKTTDFLRWHGLGLPFMVSSIILANGLLGHGKIKLLIGIGIIKVLVKITTVKMLVPSMGTQGLALSFVIVECVTMALMTIWFVKLLKTTKGTSDGSR